MLQVGDIVKNENERKYEILEVVENEYEIRLIQKGKENIEKAFIEEDVKKEQG